MTATSISEEIRRSWGRGRGQLRGKVTSSELTMQGKQLIVAVDHGLYMGNMAKLDDVVGVAELTVRWGCDGLIVSPGFARPVRAVAATVPLIVSLDTFWAGAENHAEHILIKLGFTSRAQVAAWAAGSQPDSQGCLVSRSAASRCQWSG